METGVSGGLIVVLVLAFFVLVVLAKTAVVVPQQNAFVVERLGRYSTTLGAGFHVLLPFIDARAEQGITDKEIHELRIRTPSGDRKSVV